MILNEDQNKVLLSVSEGKNTLVTGSGGVGKSVAARKIIDLYRNETVVVAPTGIAALNIGGSSIHSVFKFPHRILLDKDTANPKEKTSQLFNDKSPVKRIIIEEISMVRADMFVIMDKTLRKIRKNNSPFGGLQVIVFGDFSQLPPVVTDHEMGLFRKEYDSPYCFYTSSWSECGFNHVKLDKVMRQTDQEMIMHLNRIRVKADGYIESINFFNEHGTKNLVNVLDKDPVILCTTNKSASAINEENYSQCEGEEKLFYSRTSGNFLGQKPVPDEVKLKYGAKVIICANDSTYKNGQVGYIVGFNKNNVEVLLEETEQTVYVEKNIWSQFEYTVKDGTLVPEITATFEQIPLKLAWAITIHKSQGQTIENAVIDLGSGAFCHGQTYVALSRVKSMQGLGLFSPIRAYDVILDEKVKEFYDKGCVGVGLF